MRSRASAANGLVSLVRTDIPMAAAPESVAIGDLDGLNGKDIVVALPAAGSLGVMLNKGLPSPEVTAGDGDSVRDPSRPPMIHTRREQPE